MVLVIVDMVCDGYCGLGDMEYGDCVELYEWL